MLTYIGFSNHTHTYIMGQLRNDEMMCDINIKYTDLSKSDQSIIDNFINYLCADEISTITIDNCSFEFIGNITCSKSINFKIKNDISFSELNTTQKNKINTFFTCLYNNKKNICTDIIQN